MADMITVLCVVEVCEIQFDRSKLFLGRMLVLKIFKLFQLTLIIRMKMRTFSLTRPSLKADINVFYRNL